MKSDGNGVYNIQKGTFAIITVLIALLSCIATVVAYGVTIKSDVNYLKEEWKEGRITHPAIIDKIDDRINNLENKLLVNEEKILTMHENIEEIKTDVKTLLRK